MDWIEKIFGISPDGGDGTLEATIVAACSVGFIALLIVRFPRVRERVRQLWAGTTSLS
jgi:hypothetical protein